MALPDNRSFVILGISSSGGRFRPSDWAERLCGVMSSFGGEGRIGYSPYAQPGNLEEEKCVFVDVRIYDIEPKAYYFLENFARDNKLTTRAWEPDPQ